jgi:hypothetical protein
VNQQTVLRDLSQLKTRNKRKAEMNTTEIIAGTNPHCSHCCCVRCDRLGDCPKNHHKACLGIPVENGNDKGECKYHWEETPSQGLCNRVARN